jgi:hypothetical protein
MGGALQGNKRGPCDASSRVASAKILVWRYGETVGVGGGECELPEREAETTLKIFADPKSVFGREHEGEAFADAAGDGTRNDLRRVASHGGGVAEAEVDVVAAVNVGEMRAAGGLYEDGKGAGPFVHPVMGTPPRREDWARR